MSTTVTITRTVSYVLSQEGQRAALLAGLNAAQKQEIGITLSGSDLVRAVDIVGVRVDGAFGLLADGSPNSLPRSVEITESAQQNTSRGTPWVETVVDLRVSWEEFGVGLVADHILTAEEALALYMKRLEEYAAAMAAYKRMEEAAAARRDEVRPANAAARAAAKAAKEAQEAQAAADRAAWIEAHGSARLREAERRGYACEGILVDEVRAKVNSLLWEAGFVICSGQPGRQRDIRNPSGEGLALLRDVEALKGQILWRGGQPVAMVVEADLRSVEAEDGGSRWEEVAVGLHAAGRDVLLWIGVPGTERRCR